MILLARDLSNILLFLYFRTWQIAFYTGLSALSIKGITVDFDNEPCTVFIVEHNTYCGNNSKNWKAVNFSLKASWVSSAILSFKSEQKHFRLFFKVKNVFLEIYRFIFISYISVARYSLYKYGVNLLITSCWLSYQFSSVPFHWFVIAGELVSVLELNFNKNSRKLSTTKSTESTESPQSLYELQTRNKLCQSIWL